MDSFVANPEMTKNDRYTRYASFHRALIDRMNRSATDNPKNAKGFIDLDCQIHHAACDAQAILTKRSPPRRRLLRI